MPTISSSINTVQEQINAAAAEAGRDPAEITLVAVSKRHTEDKIIEALEAGHFVFGENYVQEGEQKVLSIKRKFPKSKFSCHFIGNLQSNKAKRAVGTFDVIETVDRLSLAEKISEVAVSRGIVQRIFVQVNISGEESKSGIDTQSVHALCSHANSLPGVSLEGLMAIGSFGDLEAQQKEFVALRELRDSVEDDLGIKLPHLSMGMSDSFELAIKEGATCVRVGTAIFGQRPG